MLNICYSIFKFLILDFGVFSDNKH